MTTRRIDRARRLASRMREMGAGHALWRAFKRLLGGRVLDAAWFRVLELTPAPNGGTGARVSEFRRGATEDARRLARAGAGGDLPARLEQGDRLCVLERGGELIASLWLRAGEWEEPELGMRFTLTPRELWLHEGLVPPALRGRGIYRRLLEATMAEVLGDQVGRILLVVEAANRNSLRAHRAVGARSLATVATVRMGRLVIAHSTGSLRFRATPPARRRRWTAFRAPPLLELPTTLLVPGDRQPSVAMPTSPST